MMFKTFRFDFRGIWNLIRALHWVRLNDEDVKLPELRIDAKRKACGLSSLPQVPAAFLLASM